MNQVRYTVPFLSYADWKQMEKREHLQSIFVLAFKDKGNKIR